MVRRAILAPFGVLAIAQFRSAAEWPCAGQTLEAGECCCMVCDGDGTDEANFRFEANNKCEELGGQCKHPSTSAYNRAPNAKLASWLAPAPGAEPEQVHMISGNPETITFVYVTNQRAQSMVEIRPADDLDDISQYTGESKTYTTMQVMGGSDGWSRGGQEGYTDNLGPQPSPEMWECGDGGGWSGYKNPECIYDSAFIHTVQVTGLKPGTMYEHRPFGRSTWRPFKTSPAVGQPISFGVLADLGTTEDSLKTMRHLDEKLNSGEINSILFGGDLSYADGYANVWDQHGRLGEFLWERAPTAYVAGNHEFANEQYQHYLQRYPSPGTARSVSGSDLYYSFEAGLAHVLMLCSYCRTEKSSNQYAFVEQDLASVDRARTPWVIVMTHVPWYTSNGHHNMKEGTKMREAMEDLLHQYKVDAFIVGHLHAYERTYGIYGNQTACDGTPHFTIGDAGNAEGPACPWWQAKLPEWEARREYSFGHGVLDIKNSTHAQWRWYRNHDGSAQTADEEWIRPASHGFGGGNPMCSASLVV